MEKPINMPIKDYLLQKVSAQLGTINDKIIPTTVITAVVNHQFDTAFSAFTYYNSIEISGFIKFTFNQKKGKKQMEKYRSQLIMYDNAINKPNISDSERRNIQMRISTTIGNIKALKPKLVQDGTKTSNGGMEE